MAHLSPETVARANKIVALYPHKRSALVPLCHLAQSEEGYLTPEAMDAVLDQYRKQAGK